MILILTKCLDKHLLCVIQFVDVLLQMKPTIFLRHAIWKMLRAVNVCGELTPTASGCRKCQRPLPLVLRFRLATLT